MQHMWSANPRHQTAETADLDQHVCLQPFLVQEPPSHLQQPHTHGTDMVWARSKISTLILSQVVSLRLCLFSAGAKEQQSNVHTAFHTHKRLLRRNRSSTTMVIAIDKPNDWWVSAPLLVANHSYDGSFATHGVTWLAANGFGVAAG